MMDERVDDPGREVISSLFLFYADKSRGGGGGKSKGGGGGGGGGSGGGGAFAKGGGVGGEEVYLRTQPRVF